MHKINSEVSKRAEFERDEIREKERTQRNVRKGGKKKQFFFLIY
jgi:hypothetical protein